MIVYVLVGGMKGTTWVQIIKAVLLIAGAALMTFWVLSKYGIQPVQRDGAAPPTTARWVTSCWPRGRSTVKHTDEGRLHLAVDGAGAGAPRVCRTC